jgi:hypothetical protein
VFSFVSIAIEGLEFDVARSGLKVGLTVAALTFITRVLAHDCIITQWEMGCLGVEPSRSGKPL